MRYNILNIIVSHTYKVRISFKPLKRKSVNSGSDYIIYINLSHVYIQVMTEQ